jgi:hypothetical protein
MKTTSLKPSLIALTLLFGTLINATEAATATYTHTNVGDHNFLFLFAETPFGFQPLTLDTVAPVNFAGDKLGWTEVERQPLTAVFSGSNVAAGNGSASIGFDYAWNNTAIQWAEVLFTAAVGGTPSSYEIKNSGRAAHNVPWFGGGAPTWTESAWFAGANTVAIDTYFSTPTPAAVPVPSALVLLASAGAFLGFKRRRGDAPAVHDHTAAVGG